MPTYDVDVGGKTYEVDAPDANTAWAWANQTHKAAGEKRTAAVAADTQKMRDQFKADDANRPWLERAAENLGAGMHSIGEGARQLGGMVGLGGGVSDEELKESRRIKAQLAEGTSGGKALQIAGEVLPTMVVPGGAVAKGAGMLPKAWKAAQVIQRAPVGMAVAEGALAGAGTGALMPTLEDESRLMNAALGAAGGGAGTAAGAALPGALSRLTQRGRDAAASRKAGAGVVDELRRTGEAPADVAARLGGRDPTTFPVTHAIPETAAERSGSTGLARAELAHRGTAPDVYMEHGRRQNEAVWEATQRAGAEGNDATLAAAQAARAEATDPMRATAMRQAGQHPDPVETLQGQARNMLHSSAPGSPQRALAGRLRELVDEGASPEQMYEFRKLLASKLSGPMIPGDDMAAITKGAQRETLEVMKAIDARLDEVSGGAFRPYMDEYAARSQPVTSARAQQQITEKLSGGPLIGDAPQVTRHGLDRAVGRFAQNKQGFERLTPEARSRYDELGDFLRQKEEPMRALKLAGTGGGGSQTAMQRSAIEGLGMGVANMKMPGVSVMLRAVGDKLGENARRELAEMLADPLRTQTAIRAALRAEQPLSPTQKAFLAVAQSGGLGAGLSLSPTQ
jgi:hypothetical protein